VLELKLFYNADEVSVGYEKIGTKVAQIPTRTPTMLKRTTQYQSRRVRQTITNTFPATVSMAHQQVRARPCRALSADRSPKVPFVFQVIFAFANQ